MANGEPASAREIGPAVFSTSSLPRAGGFSFLGAFAYQFCLWTFFIALARLGGSETLGAFTIALTVCAPLALLTNLQLTALLSSESRAADRLGAYLGMRMLGLCASLPLALVLAWALGMGTTGILLVLLVAGAKAVESFADLLRGALVAHQRFAAAASLQLVRGLLGLLGGSLMLCWHGTAAAAAIGLAGGWLLAVIIVDLPVVLRSYPAASMRPRWWDDEVRALLRSGLPLGVGAAALGLASYIPVYALELWQDHQMVGRYAALMHVLMIGNLLASSFATAAAPVLGRHFAHDAPAAVERLVWRLVASACALALAAAAVSWLIGDWFLRLAYGEEFAGLGGLLALSCLAAMPAWATSGLGVALTAARRTTAIPLVVLGGCGGGVAVAAALVPTYGLGGAIAAFACTSLIIFILCLMLLRQTLRRTPEPQLDR